MPGNPRGDQRWSTFLRNHANAIVACDFFVAVTATFRLLYVFVMIEHGSRRLLHVDVTTHPTAAWTLQQLRDAIGCEDSYRYLIHDRDTIFAKGVDESIGRLGLRVLKSPLQSPMANAICERVIGTIRFECSDRLICSKSHLPGSLRLKCFYYNHPPPPSHRAGSRRFPSPSGDEIGLQLELPTSSRRAARGRRQIAAGWGCTTTIHSSQGRVIDYLRSTGHLPSFDLLFSPKGDGIGRPSRARSCSMTRQPTHQKRLGRDPGATGGAHGQRRQQDGSAYPAAPANPRTVYCEATTNPGRSTEQAEAPWRARVAHRGRQAALRRPVVDRRGRRDDPRARLSKSDCLPCSASVVVMTVIPPPRAIVTPRLSG